MKQNDRRDIREYSCVIAVTLRAAICEILESMVSK